MALENIIQKILNDANARAGALMKDASSKSEEILKKADLESAALKAKIVEEASLTSTVEMDLAYASKGLEIRKDLLRKKRELIDKAFDEASRTLLDLDDKRYAELLEKMVLAQIPKGSKGEIRFFRRDERRVKADLVERLNAKGGLKLAMGPYMDKEDLGFVVTMGKVIIDSSFSRGLEAIKDKMQFEVSKKLFG